MEIDGLVVMRVDIDRIWLARREPISRSIHVERVRDVCVFYVSVSSSEERIIASIRHARAALDRRRVASVFVLRLQHSYKMEAWPRASGASAGKQRKKGLSPIPFKTADRFVLS